MSDYADRQRVRNAQAREEYERLLPTLDPAVREVLTRKPGRGDECAVTVLDMNDGTKVARNRGGDDAAVMPEASEKPDIAGAVDSLADTLAENFGITLDIALAIVRWHRAIVEEESLRTVARKLARISGLLLNHANVHLAIHALAYATHSAEANGLDSMRKTCARIEKASGEIVSTAALSKMACWLVGFLGLPPGEGMKKDSAIPSYIAAAKRSHVTRRNRKMERAINLIK